MAKSVVRSVADKLKRKKGVVIDPDTKMISLIGFENQKVTMAEFYKYVKQEEVNAMSRPHKQRFGSPKNWSEDERKVFAVAQALKRPPPRYKVTERYAFGWIDHRTTSFTFTLT